MTTKKPFVIDERIERLGRVYKKLPTKDQPFAKSLIDNYCKTKGKLSDKQWYWVQQMSDRASGANVAQFGNAKTVASVVESLDNSPRIPHFGRVEEMLRTALAHKQFPFIKLETAHKQQVELRPRQYEKGVGVKVGDVKIGKIVDEIFINFGPHDATMLQAVLGLLRGFAENPQQGAATYGRKTGHCCFCSIFLSDPRSVKVGYGPICAENHGLPWGEEKSEFDGAFNG